MCMESPSCRSELTIVVLTASTEHIHSTATVTSIQILSGQSDITPVAQPSSSQTTAAPAAGLPVVKARQDYAPPSTTIISRDYRVKLSIHGSTPDPTSMGTGTKAGIAVGSVARKKTAEPNAEQAQEGQGQRPPVYTPAPDVKQEQGYGYGQGAQNQPVDMMAGPSSTEMEIGHR
ncbi:Protein of unknown function [Pyronema omphalodes CBS 100304]|uniref:Uncharacterized protein n=1 Tax=Pyronema omphalodes (strain CBS 100304) TaxID=1076935 RepID=U4LFI1_PYROM|nr:Protein of unknown function [Pyronema omphalodes CBS 100304]